MLEHKASAHEVSLEMQQMQARVEELQRELSKRLQTCALQKDLAYLQSVVEQKASVEEMNEALQ